LPDDPIPVHLRRISQQVRDIRLMQSRWLLCSDPPDHTRLRNVVEVMFCAPMVERMRGRIQRIVDQLLDAVEARDEMDIIDDLAYPLPSNIITELLGVPMPDRGVFRQWSADIAAASTWTAPVLERAHASQHALADYLRELIAARRVAPSDDLLSTLVAAESEHLLSEEEVLATCVLLLFVGHETTTNLIGNGTLALLRHPGERRRMQSDPVLIRSAIEELLRYDSPVQGAFRRAKVDLEVGGQSIRQGEHVLLLLGAANRDPEQFPDPDTLDLGRADNRHLSFGFGPHYCLGAMLARLEGQAAIQTLFRRYPSLCLAQGQLAWRPNVLFRGLKHLPVLLQGATGDGAGRQDVEEAKRTGAVAREKGSPLGQRVQTVDQ
jgi:cytochrome P450